MQVRIINIGRNALLKRLQQRCNLEDKGPVNVKVRLPSFQGSGQNSGVRCRRMHRPIAHY